MALALDLSPLPLPDPVLAAAAARWADTLATVLGTYKAGAPKDVMDSLMPGLWAAAFHYSTVASAILDRDGYSKAGAKWSAIADGALWTAIHLGAKG